MRKVIAVLALLLSVFYYLGAAGVLDANHPEFWAGVGWMNFGIYAFLLDDATKR